MPQRQRSQRNGRPAGGGAGAAAGSGPGSEPGPAPGSGAGSGAARGGTLPFDPIQRAFDLWERRWGRSTSMLAVTSLMRAHQLVLAEVDAIVRPYGLTFARYEALVLLTFSRRGALPLSKIGERLQVHPTSVTNIVDRLANAGMVERKPNPLDGRGVLAEITAAGRDAVEKATADLMAADFGLGALAEGQHLSLFGTLRDLRLAAGDFSDGAQEPEDRAVDGADD
ncbi:MAG TPA: MarR family transcriptional regulator [Actinocrinis sp.]|jgi:DNA-binding MarR family transcriptional regulator